MFSCLLSVQSPALVRRQWLGADCRGTVQLAGGAMSPTFGCEEGLVRRGQGQEGGQGEEGDGQGAGHG